MKSISVVLCLQLLVALDALKSLGVLHTDIKPDNVMIVSKGDIRIKLVDFGLAVLASQVQPGYMVSPVGYRWVQSWLSQTFLCL